MEENPFNNQYQQGPVATMPPPPPQPVASPQPWQPQVPPPPPPPTSPVQDAELSDLTPRNDLPVAVVQALSVRGVEYAMMTFSLWLVAGSVIWVLIALINGGTSFKMLVLPTAILIACVPVFGYLFLRLKREELAKPELRFDPSKRRLSQFTQIIAFSACLFNVIGFIYLVLQKAAGESGPTIVKSFLTMLIVLIVAGGVLAYYWWDEHKLRNRGGPCPKIFLGYLH